MAAHSRSAQNTSCPPGLGFSGARGLASPCEPLRADLFERVGVEVYVKRDDLLSPHLSGNKARKLLHQLPLLKGQGPGATLGGASSTHLHAFALAGALEGFAPSALCDRRRASLRASSSSRHEPSGWRSSVLDETPTGGAMSSAFTVSYRTDLDLFI